MYDSRNPLPRLQCLVTMDFDYQGPKRGRVVGHLYRPKLGIRLDILGDTVVNSLLSFPRALKLLLYRSIQACMKESGGLRTGPSGYKCDRRSIEPVRFLFFYSSISYSTSHWNGRYLTVSSLACCCWRASRLGHSQLSTLLW